MYLLARQSAVRLIVDTIADLGGEAQYYDWDAHAEQFELPDADLFGLVGFSCTQNGQFHDVTFGVGIMSKMDMNLTRMVGYIDTFYKRLQAQERFSIFLPDGTESGFDCVIFDGTSVSPLTRVDQRPAQTVNCAGRLGVAGFTFPEE
jgi:hypothetical protein